MSILLAKNFALLMLGVTIGFGGVTACSNYALLGDAPVRSQRDTTIKVRVDDATAFSEVMDKLAAHRIIAVAETHTLYEHHLNQLAVIKALKRRGVHFAIGLEIFQRPFQPFLDAYVRGEVSEKAMLKQTKYFQRWRFDYRLYRPIVEYAQRYGIPLVALNAPSELVKEVSSEGFEGVGPARKGQLPEIVLPPDRPYKRRMKAVFAMHSPNDDRRFDRFLEVQLLWEEFMAKTAADYLVDHPDRSLVILAGSGHLRDSSGIPNRLLKRSGIDPAIVLSGTLGGGAAGEADVVLLAERKSLPRAGRLGWRIGEYGGGVGVMSDAGHGATGSENMPPRSRIIRIAGEFIRSIEDVRLAMLDRLPGEEVWVELEHEFENGAVESVSAIVELI